MSGRKKRDWEELFSPHILERGLDYCEMGNVVELEWKGGQMEAVVEGTEDYDVRITLQDGQVTGMSCTCPYAEGGENCKHMAAVLYELEEETDEDLNEEQESDEEIDAVIDSVPEAALRDFIKRLAHENGYLRGRVLSEFQKAMGTAQMDHLKEQVRNICDQYTDGFGYVHWKDSSDFVLEMLRVLDDMVQPLADRGEILPAFELTCEVFCAVAEQEVLDDGDDIWLADGCYDMWKKLLGAADEREQKKIRQWFEGQQKGRLRNEFMEEYLERFLLNEFHDRETLLWKMQKLDGEIQRAEESDAWRLGDLVVSRICVMRELELPEEEIQAYTQGHYALSEVRDLLIKECLDRNQMGEAIRILKESKELDEEKEGLRKQRSEQLLSLYEQEHQMEAYREELLFQLFHCTQDDTDYVKELKRCTEPADWPAMRQRLLDAESCRYIWLDILEEEELFQELFDAVTADNTIHCLDRYEAALKPHYPEQLLNLYTQYANRIASFVANRKRYREVMHYLKKISTYPGGEAEARRIAARWRELYRRRSAMMDELTKAGF